MLANYLQNINFSPPIGCIPPACFRPFFFEVSSLKPFFYGEILIPFRRPHLPLFLFRLPVPLPSPVLSVSHPAVIPLWDLQWRTFHMTRKSLFSTSNSSQNSLVITVACLKITTTTNFIWIKLWKIDPFKNKCREYRISKTRKCGRTVRVLILALIPVY